MEQSPLAVFSALWLGILNSISPWPLSTNIAAVSYVGRRVSSPRAVLLADGMYTGGHMLACAVLGAAAVWSVMSVVTLSAFLQGTVHRLLGILFAQWRLATGDER
ncbi:MAG: hypothetical protein A2177_08530 [Spirochaetes bacterium RBG_13_68_11]|nr:MAG: hypothetical protein A2177_08530 [Spirochaetes bacterium RBG_13_68_11]